MFKKEENWVAMNPQYRKYLQDLEAFYEDEVGSDAEKRGIAKKFFDDEYCVTAGRFVIQAWFNKGRPEFSDDDFEHAISAGALTATLTSTETLREARKKYRQKMNSAKTEAMEGER